MRRLAQLMSTDELATNINALEIIMLGKRITKDERTTRWLWRMHTACSDELGERTLTLDV